MERGYLDWLGVLSWLVYEPRAFCGGKCVCLADDDVSLRRGVTKTKMPRTEVKHYWLSPSVDAFLRSPKDKKRPSDFRWQQREVGCSGGVVKRQRLPNETR